MNIKLYQGHADAVLELAATCPDSEFIFFGDYNIPDSIWIPSDNGLDFICPDTSLGKLINDTLNALVLCQINGNPINHGVLLELLYSYFLN